MTGRTTLAAAMLSGALAVQASVAAETTAHLVLRDGISVDVIERDLQSSGHRIPRCKAPDEYCPKTYVVRIVVNVNGQRYSLPSDGMYDAWGAKGDENPQSKFRHFGGHCATSSYCVFRGVFSDASETYVVQWEIAQGKAERTVFTSAEDVVNLVMDNIDGPADE